MNTRTLSCHHKEKCDNSADVSSHTCGVFGKDSRERKTSSIINISYCQIYLQLKPFQS